MLMPGEQVLHFSFMVRRPGLLVQMLLVGGLLLFLLTKAYYVVLTNRRMILIRTKQGMFSPQMVNMGVEQWDVTQIARCTTSGLLNNRSMTFHFRDGKKQTLRISPWFRLVSGTKAFFEQVPNLINSGQLAAGAMTGAPMSQQLPGQAAMGQPGGPPQLAAAGGGVGPGARVMVLWTDGQRYPATVVQNQGGHFLCTMPNGQQQWVPAQNVSPA